MERLPSSYCYGPVVPWITTHASLGGSHGGVEPSGDDLPSGRVPGRDSEPSRARVDNDGDDETFRGFLIGYLVFWGRNSL